MTYLVDRIAYKYLLKATKGFSSFTKKRIDQQQWVAQTEDGRSRTFSVVFGSFFTRRSARYTTTKFKGTRTPIAFTTLRCVWWYGCLSALWSKNVRRYVFLFTVSKFYLNLLLYVDKYTLSVFLVTISPDHWKVLQLCKHL